VLVFVSVPFELLLEKYFSKVIEHRVNVEVVLKAEALDRYFFPDFKKVGEAFLEAGIRTTVHLPFMDLSPGALDPWIREVSVKRVVQAMERAISFEPLNLVLHTGYHPFYHREVAEKWREIFKGVLEEILKKAEELGLSLSLENVFEPEPGFLRPFFEAFEGRLFWCFDPAHARVFSRKRELDWLKELYPYLKEIHCHDNRGEVDEHLAIGKGVIEFEKIWEFLREKGIRPLLVSEAHTEEETLYNREYLSSLRF
jgi:sugar phosphate isomerase/epimerase